VVQLHHELEQLIEGYCLIVGLAVRVYFENSRGEVEEEVFE
jgi:hypothetical protein